MTRLFFHFLQDPVVLDTLPEYDGVLHQGEEDQHHAGQQPDLHGSDGVRDGYPGSTDWMIIVCGNEGWVEVMG